VKKVISLSVDALSLGECEFGDWSATKGVAQTQGLECVVAVLQRDAVQNNELRGVEW